MKNDEIEGSIKEEKRSTPQQEIMISNNNNENNKEEETTIIVLEDTIENDILNSSEEEEETTNDGLKAFLEENYFLNSMKSKGSNNNSLINNLNNPIAGDNNENPLSNNNNSTSTSEILIKQPTFIVKEDQSFYPKEELRKHQSSPNVKIRGLIKIEEVDHNDLIDNFTSQNIKKIKEFEEILNDYHNFAEKNPRQLRRLIRGGIPTRDLLKAYWKRFVGSEELPNKYPGLYKKLTQHEDTLADEAKILKDVHRTYPQYSFFRQKDGEGQKSLFRILKAYAYFDKQVGYVQGMAFICGFALMNLEDEEETFWFFVQLINNTKHGLKDLFAPNLPLLRLLMHITEELMKLRMPDVYKLLQEQYVTPEMYASPFILALCTNRIPFIASQQIWSIFLNEGWKMIIRLIVGFFKLARNEIFECNATEIMSTIYKKAQDTDPEKILQVAFSVKLTTKMIREFTASYEQTLEMEERRQRQYQRENQKKLEEAIKQRNDSKRVNRSNSFISFFEKIASVFKTQQETIEEQQSDDTDIIIDNSTKESVN
ncbi:hypothetical protein ABK040_005324 [Willaertia magna]